ncbi:hypothetical protein BKA62DRAFT_688255 [Auriculariales sp. MPI-PUGE-AT-0066]|nr:hypothetical protein BKA62DRAFT_688255 [Auriculariales sp. MPI-PUGE-AT-0066]
MRSPVTCHVLDSSQGKPAAGIPVKLEKIGDAGAAILAQGTTDADGRCTTLLSSDSRLELGVYKMTFDTSEYLETVTGQPAFYPYVEVRRLRPWCW